MHGHLTLFATLSFFAVIRRSTMRLFSFKEMCFFGWVQVAY
jgi:hypothetical protein